MNTIFKQNVRIDRLFGGDAARQRAQSYADQRGDGYEVRDLDEIPRTETHRAGLDPIGKREGIQYTCAVVEVKTAAEQIAEQFGNDGQNWRDDDGAHLDYVCTEHECYVDGYRSTENRDLFRYEFADGSAIVTSPAGWDIEGSEPFSWAGAE